MHESFEAPATIEIWAVKNNHEVTHTRLYQGDILPEDAEDFDFRKNSHPGGGSEPTPRGCLV